MIKRLLFIGMLLCPLETFANILYFSQDMTEHIYLLDKLFQSDPSTFDVASVLGLKQNSSKSQWKNSLYQPPASIIEELIRKLSPTIINGEESQKDVIPIELEIAGESLDSFFHIGFATVDGERSAELVSSAISTDDNLSGIDARGMLEDQLKKNEVVKQAALDLRSFYRETDFSSVTVKFGDYNTNFSIAPRSSSSRSVLQGLEPRNRKNKELVDDSASSRFASFIPSFLFSGTFWLVSYLVLCIAIFARSMLRRR